MKKILAILTAVAAISMLIVTASAANEPKLTDKNTITIYAPADGDPSGAIKVTVTGTAALTGQSGPKGLAVASDEDPSKIGIVAIGAKAGDAVAVLTFSGSGTVTITGVDGDYTGVSGTFEVGAGDAGEITTAAEGEDTTATAGGATGGSDNTKTGVVIAIVPMALAAAAAAVSKKK